MKTGAVIKIALAVIGLLVVFMVAGGVIMKRYVIDDLIKGASDIPVKHIEADMKKLSALMLEPPVAVAHRDYMAGAGVQLMRETRANLALLKTADKEKTSIDEKMPLSRKYLTHLLLLQAVSNIVKDDKLSSAEYTAWVSFYEARNKENNMKERHDFMQHFKMHKKPQGLPQP